MSALSYDRAGQIETRLQAEVAELMARAEAVDRGDVPDGMQIPEALARHEKRLAAREGHVNACAAAGIVPVFCSLKSELGLRQFLLHGADQVRSAWSLVALAWTMKRLFVLGDAI